MILIYGLGINGGGINSALYFAKKHKDVLITDLKDESYFKDFMPILKEYKNIRYKFGLHDEKDFFDAEIIIKNPAIKRGNEYVTKYKQKIQTDISIFLSQIQNPIIAVTGSKGKSSIVSGINHVLEKQTRAFLGGNITISPLSFLQDIKADDTIILELSSFQLGDLKYINYPIKPKISIISNIYQDHQNYYDKMEDYVNDKKYINNFQNQSDISIFYYDDFGIDFAKKSKGKVLFVSDKKIISQDGIFLQNEDICLRYNGNYKTFSYQKKDASTLFIILALYAYGIELETILKDLSSFSGIRYRKEFVKNINGIKIYNDSCSTISESVFECFKYDFKINLICGGDDKLVNYKLFEKIFQNCNKICFLQGSGTSKMLDYIDKKNEKFLGVFESLEDCFYIMMQNSQSGDSVFFSPGCSSFEKFKNEFDRGYQFSKIVNQYHDKS